MSDTSTSDIGLSEEEKKEIRSNNRNLVSTKIVVTNGKGEKLELTQDEYDDKTKKSKEFNTLITKFNTKAQNESQKANTLFKEGTVKEAQDAAEQAMISAAKARKIGDEAQKLWDA
jgi:hypothetical protein